MSTKHLEKKTKALAAIMMVSGLIIWLLSSSTKSWAPDLMLGLGIFLFIYGTLYICDQRKWSQLSDEKKRVKIIVLSILVVLLIAGVIYSCFTK